eukprot:g10270.t1
MAKAMAFLLSSPSPGKGVRVALWSFAAAAACVSTACIACLIVARHGLPPCRTVPGSGSIPTPSESAVTVVTVENLAATTTTPSTAGDVPSQSSGPGYKRYLETRLSPEQQRTGPTGQLAPPAEKPVPRGDQPAAEMEHTSTRRPLGRSLRRKSGANEVRIMEADPGGEEEEKQPQSSDEPESFETALPPAVEVGYRGNFDFEGFPPVEGSTTLMFMHIFKCAGSTLRHMLVDWAQENGQRGAIVRECDHLDEEGDICLHDYELINEAVQVEKISHLKVLAGHFMWGFQRHVKTPYLMVTALRNPLEVYVSGKQYMYRHETSTLPKAQQFITESMLKVMSVNSPIGLQQGQISGFIRRFAGVPRRVWFKDGLEAGAEDAIRNLETFWIVGVVEQYRGFERVLQASIDPIGNHAGLWNRYAEVQYNSSPIGTRDVLAEIDPELIQRFNGTLALQWKVCWVL